MQDETTAGDVRKIERPSEELVDGWREEGFLRELRGESATPIVHHVAERAVEWAEAALLKEVEELNATVSALKSQLAEKVASRIDDPDTLQECARRLLLNADSHDMSADALIRSISNQEDENRKKATKQSAWEERGCAMGLRYMAHHFMREAVTIRNQIENHGQGDNHE